MRNFNHCHHEIYLICQKTWTLIPSVFLDSGIVGISLVRAETLYWFKSLILTPRQVCITWYKSQIKLCTPPWSLEEIRIYRVQTEKSQEIKTWWALQVINCLRTRRSYSHPSNSITTKAIKYMGEAVQELLRTVINNILKKGSGNITNH